MNRLRDSGGRFVATTRVESIARRLPAVREPSLAFILASMGVVGLAAVVIGLWSTAYMGIATANFGFLICGLLFRYRQVAHIWLMSFGIAGDLALVLLLQIQRDAIGTVIALNLSPLQQAHVGVSTLATALYIPTIYYGVRRRLGSLDYRIRVRHMVCGMLAFLFRVLGFVFMFSLLNRPAGG